MPADQSHQFQLQFPNKTPQQGDAYNPDQMRQLQQAAEERGYALSAIIEVLEKYEPGVVTSLDGRRFEGLFLDLGIDDTVPTDVPQFTPTLNSGTTSSTLNISPGWLHAPYASKATGEIHEHLQYPWMPTIDSKLLNAADPNALALSNGDTNYIELRISRQSRETRLGDSMATNIDQETPSNESETNVIGVTVKIPSIKLQDGNGDISSFTPEAYVLLDNIDYDVELAPEFKANVTGWTVDNFSDIYLPWGKYQLDSDGVPVNTPEWYWTGPRSISFPSITRGGDVSGWAVVGKAGGDDTAANPKLNTT